MSDDILHSSTSNDRILKPNGSISGASGAFNPRSCITCRRRKVKCDKKQPCSNCARAKIECIFPGPGRAPRKSRKPPDGELMDRLKRLEGVVQSLNAQVEEHENEAAERERRTSSDGACPNAAAAGPQKRRVVEDNSVEGLESRFGRLVVDQGRSRYINNSFWASLNNEVEDLKSILIEPSDEDGETYDSPSSGITSQHQGFVFGFSSSNVDMLSLHPTPERGREFWAIFKENVDPLVKVVHIPSFEPVILDAMTHPEKVSKGLECMMFAIYYGAVTSVPPEDFSDRWGEDRSVLIVKYRFALEQALARANFLYCDETIILQAFVIFLMLLRRNDDARKIWTLTGLVVRIAQTLGVHRDGSHFNLPPFEIEMRRRLWWQVCILDARASEDHGCDPTIVEAQFDAKMPLNLNDRDIDPKMKELPEERSGFTDMTFSIIRFEVANIMRRILYVPPGPNRCSEFFANLTIPEKEKWISDCHQRLEEKYLKDGDMTVPLYWVTATISRLVMSKMWLIVYHPHQRRDGGASLPQETKDKLFITSLENLEYSILLETEARTMKWGWLFRTYVQWHAVAFLLSELCVRTKGEAVERAWRALEATAGRWWFPLTDTSEFSKGKQGCLWKPLRKLMSKARAARERELALERASKAIRNGSFAYSDFPQLPQRMEHIADAALDQPSPESLDKLLRPTAPRLGEVPAAKPPSWTGSPSATGLHSPLLDGASSLNGISSMNGANENVNKDINYFDAIEYGLDTILSDVMHGMKYDGTSVYDDNHMEVMNLPSTNSQQTQTATLPTSAADAMAGLDGFTQPSGAFNADFEDSPSTMDASSSGQNSNSPLLDNGASMDWANWDDLVREYGTDGAQGQMTTNGVGHLGMVNWF